TRPTPPSRRSAAPPDMGGAPADATTGARNARSRPNHTLTEESETMTTITPEPGSEPRQTTTVRVRHRAAEDPWGRGALIPVVWQVTMPAASPRAGGPRGVARNVNQCGDGAYQAVEEWDTPGGHVDLYAAVVEESAEV